MRTNSKEVRKQIRQHILDCVKDPEYNEYTKFEDAANRVVTYFKQVADHKYNLKRLPNHQERFSDWLWGLPFSFEYTNDGIKDFLNGLGINPTNKEFDSDKSNKLYHYLIWHEVSDCYYNLS